MVGEITLNTHLNSAAVLLLKALQLSLQLRIHL
jgi:hypothetical protein